MEVEVRRFFCQNRMLPRCARGCIPASDCCRIKAGNGSGVTVQNAGGIEVKDLVVMGDDYKTNVGSGIKIVNVRHQ